VRVKLEMQSRDCPVCGSSAGYKIHSEASFDPGALDSFAFASRKIPEYMHYRMLECMRCDVLYANPLPTRSSLEQAYREAAYDSGEEANYGSLAYAAFLPGIVAKLPHRAAALDIGAGDGAFLKQLRSYDFGELVGVEPSAAPVAAAEPETRALLRQTPFRSGDFEKNHFSLITCFQTMEHVYDPMALCRDALGLLKEGGALFLVCHNRRALSARVLGRKSPIFDIEHLQLFSPRSLRCALESAGFSQVELHTVVNRYPLHYWFKLFPMPPGFKKQLLGRLKETALGGVPIKLSAGNFAAIGYKRSAG
jgi:SAM-dependent methyltransferase